MMSSASPSWIKPVLLAAAVYNVLWGAAAVLLPQATLSLIGMPDATAVFWQCIGMIVGVYGIGYAIAAFDPARHWPIVLVGLAGKVFGPIGFVFGVLTDQVPVRMIVTIVANDLIWWVPFAMILWHAVRSRGAVDDEGTVLDLASAIERPATASGASLATLSADQPVLLVFLRHLGCTFCREAMADLAARRAAIESAGAKIAIVHQSSEADGRAFAARYGLDDAIQISDPSRVLYSAFELSRGRFSQLFGFRVWLRGIAALARGHGIGALKGDVLQMPGAFVIHRGAVVRAFRHDSAADRPDYCELVSPAG